MDTSPESLSAKLADWVRREGFPFEVKVAKAFQNAWFLVSQSNYYLDPETKKHREIEVIAMIHSCHQDVVLRVEFLIECKSSKDKPSLLFYSDSEPSISSGTLIWRNPMTSVVHTLIDVLTQESIESFAAKSFEAAKGFICDHADLLVKTRKEVI
jgi:hypothetical protein